MVGDWEQIKIGEGNIICAGNIFTTDIEIGSFNVFNLDCTVGHDTVIGSYNIINPSVNISGGVKITKEILRIFKEINRDGHEKIYRSIR